MQGAARASMAPMGKSMEMKNTIRITKVYMVKVDSLFQNQRKRLFFPSTSLSSTGANTTSPARRYRAEEKDNNQVAIRHSIMLTVTFN